MIHLLLILVLAAHLLAVNLASGGPFICMWLDARAARRQDPTAAALSRSLALWSLIAFAIGMALGGIALWLASVGGDAQFFRGAALVPASRYWFGIAELVCYAVALLGYLALARRGPAAPRCGRLWGLWGLLLFAGTDLVYHFPPLFAIIGVLGTRAETWDVGVSFRGMMLDPEVLAFTFHFMLASLATTGIALMLVARQFRAAEHDSTVSGTIVWGGRIALAATVLQLLDGIWLLIASPPSVRDNLFGQDMLASGLLGAALLATVALLHRLIEVALGETARGRIATCAGLLVLIVGLMVGAQHRARGHVGSDHTNLIHHGTLTDHAVRGVVWSARP